MPIELHISNLAKDQQILQYARDVASEVLTQDPLFEKPENIKLKKLISRASDIVDWRMIS